MSFPSMPQKQNVIPASVHAFAAAITCCALLLPISALAANALAPAPKPYGPAPTAPVPPESAAQDSASGFGPLDPSAPSGFTADQIITKFAARESEFAQARNEYTFRESVKVDTINDDTGKPDGEYQQTTDIIFSEGGARTEHVVFAPANTLSRIMMTEADFDDIAHRLPFVLTTADLPQYDITYLGRQRVDELDTYVFEAGPKRIEKNHRYFKGKVWVDQKDLQIVLINGKSVPDDLRRGHEDLSPPYTTYYEEIDGHYWFPTYTHADGILHFAAQPGALANDVRIRYTVKYTDYKRFHAKSRIIYEGQTLPSGAPAPANPDGKPASSPDAAPIDPKALPPVDPNAPPLAHPANPHP
jgi:hypothetical protein